jgi:hypothetical protein
MWQSAVFGNSFVPQVLDKPAFAAYRPVISKLV